VAEKEIVASIARYLAGIPRCFFWKTHGGMYGTAGIPDIIACIGGKFVAFEVKTETGRLTKLQSATLAKIQNAKGIAYKVTSVKEVSEILKAEGLLHDANEHSGQGISRPDLLY
jgi:hypothetical protein